MLSQRPDSTGSGIYFQAMLRESAANNHTNYLIAGVEAHNPAELEGIAPKHCAYIFFKGADMPFRIVGMSDVMPYPSKRFRDLTETELSEYETSLEAALRRHMHGAIKKAFCDYGSIRERLALYTWKSVFRRVQRVYDEAIFN